MAGRAAIAPKFVQEAKIRSMTPSTASGPSASTAKATISSWLTSAIWKLSVMPSPVMAATSIPSAWMLSLIFSFSSSTYGVITPMFSAPEASIAVRTAPMVDTTGAPVSSLICWHSCAS